MATYLFVIVLTIAIYAFIRKKMGKKAAHISLGIYLFIIALYMSQFFPYNQASAFLYYWLPGFVIGYLLFIFLEPILYGDYYK